MRRFADPGAAAAGVTATDPDRIRALRVADANGRAVPLTQLARVDDGGGPGADQPRDGPPADHGGVQRARPRPRRLRRRGAGRGASARCSLPPGYSLAWGGQFQNLQEATARLTVVVPAALALIFGLLYVMFRSLRLAALIFVNVPFAATGGVLALWLRGLPFSISAAVGFIALFGIAVLNGVVLVTHHRASCGRTGQDAMAAARDGGDDAAAAGADDGAGRQPRLPADGDLDRAPGRRCSGRWRPW